MDWNYEELGFKSQKEMEESIKRVNAAKINPKNDLEERAENRAKFDLMNKDGGIDFKGLEEGARLEELDRVVASKLYREKEEVKRKAEQGELDKLLKAATETIIDEKKTKAESEIKEEEEKLQRELDQKIKNQYGLDSKEELERNKVYKGLLEGLNLKG